jgi:hypothetical protein
MDLLDITYNLVCYYIILVFLLHNTNTFLSFFVCDQVAEIDGDCEGPQEHQLQLNFKKYLNFHHQ